MSHSHVWHDSFTCVTWLIHMCDVTHSYVWHDSFICATWLVHMCDMTHSYVWHDSFICVTWLVHICDATPSYVWRNSFIWETDSFICVTWLLHMCDVTRSYVWHDSFICVTTLLDTSFTGDVTTPPQHIDNMKNWETSVQIQIEPNVLIEFVPRDTGISKFSDLLHIRGAACSEISGVQHVQRYTLYRAAKTHKQLNFRKRATNYRALLWKIAYNDKASYESSPPCTGVTSLISHVCYGVATISRIDRIIGLFCRIASLLWDSFAKETYNFIDLTNISHLIWIMHVCAMTCS